MQNSDISKQPWSVDVSDIYLGLHTSAEGLSREEVTGKEKRFGKNIFQSHEKKSAMSIFAKQLASPLIFILIAAGVVTGLLKEWVEVSIISLAVLVNTLLGFYREYHAETTLEKLSTYIKDRAIVIRTGKEQEVDSSMLFPGDILKLSYGNRIPADARLIETNNLSVNEAILTGESDAVQKNIGILAVSAEVAERKNMVHAGTLVVDGFARAVITATGNNTEIGKIAGLVSQTNRAKTPIQKGVERLAWIIFAVVILIVTAIFILGVFRGQDFFEMLILSVAVSVGAVPEALPIALTVILSIGAERIAKKKGITRTLLAAETLGSTTLIMTDKTGTLTEANMKLVGVHTTEELISGEKRDADNKALLRAALTNVDVFVENSDDHIDVWSFKGKPFEVNIVKTAREQGVDISSIKQGSSSSILIPFNSSHKFSVSRNENDFTIMGAPDILLARSKISKEEFLVIESWIAHASSEGKRLIAIGSVKSLPDTLSIHDVQNISFLGIMAFHDPIRKNVAKAIDRIQALGTKIIMITGDLKGTALSVANELGWNVSEKHVLTGHDIKSLSDEDLIQIIPEKRIFARVTPEDKLRIGSLYRQLGEVVAMTGDGVNDAPALKAMDIGIALGSGSDVAKSAADLILLDDNFEIIIAAIEEGRRILVNVRKTFVYLMSNSLNMVFVIGGSLIFNMAIPLTALQIIWINLFTGSLPALAFAYDDDFDHEKSSKNNLKSLFTREVNILTFGIGTASSLLLFLMYYLLIDFGFEIALAQSILFACVGSYILVIAFSFRSLHKSLFSYSVFSNKKLNQAVAFAGFLLVGTIVIPSAQSVFGLAPIPLVWLWFIVGWLILNVSLVEGAKFLFRRSVKKSH